MARRRSGLVVAAAVVGLLAAGEARAASIDVGSASGSAGSEVTVDVSLQAMDATVLGTQNRIDFARATPIAANPGGTPDCAVNGAINKNATAFRFLPLGCDPAADCQSVRAFVLAFDNLDPIADGAVLYTCHITIAADAQRGTYTLHNTEFLASAPGGQSIPTTGSDGSVEVVAPPVASIDVGSASGPAGTTTAFSVTFRLLTEPPADVAGIQNDIAFASFTPIVATPGGRPACSVSPDIDKEATSFTFLPMGCTPGLDCSGVRTFVLSTSNTNSIADGATLYSCQVAIAPGAPLAAYPLIGSMAVASGPRGEMLPALASDGAIEVTESPPPVCVGDCNGDHVVAINELLLGVNIVTGGAELSVCPVLDVNDDGLVAVNEVVQAVNNALNGCPPG